MSRRLVGLAAVGIILCVVVQVAWCQGVRSIGVRAVLPIGRVPFLVGIEATGDASFGLLTGSFFLSSEGRVLITASCDVQLVGGAQGNRTFVRGTLGLYYFDPRAFLPSLLFGGGVAVDVPIASFLAFAASGEFLYPLAFPSPMVSASGRWLLP